LTSLHERVLAIARCQRPGEERKRAKHGGLLAWPVAWRADSARRCRICATTGLRADRRRKFIYKGFIRLTLQRWWERLKNAAGAIRLGKCDA